MVRGRLLVCMAACAGALAFGCNALLGLGNYRSCDGGECTADASATETGPPAAACEASADCVAADAGLLCSSGACASVTSLARGMSTSECAVLSDGTARCWGNNAAGQLGNAQPSPTNVAQPQVVLDEFGQPMTGIQQISLGYDFACALRTTGTNSSVWCWGTSASGGGGGQLKPQQVNLGNSAVLSVSAANDSACALVHETARNNVYCWGTNTNGKMGCDNGLACEDGGAPSPSTPTVGLPYLLPTVKEPKFLANGLYALCIGFASSGFIDCFGTDGFGGLGDGTATPSSCCAESNPEPVLAATMVDLQGSDFYTCAQDDNKTWSCWGGNLGEGCPLLNGCADLHAPTQLSIGAGSIVNLTPGWRHACGITSDAVWCWGQNDHGQVGDNTRSGSDVGPTKTLLPVRAHDIAAHRHFTCALGDDGQVYCWGQNGDQNDSTPWLVGVGSPQGDVLTPKPVVWE